MPTKLENAKAKIRSKLLSNKLVIPSTWDYDRSDAYDETTGEVTVGDPQTVNVNLVTPAPIKHERDAPDGVVAGDLKTSFVPDDDLTDSVEVGDTFTLRGTAYACVRADEITGGTKSAGGVLTVLWEIYLRGP
jgi:hypothetical protein